MKKKYWGLILTLLVLALALTGCGKKPQTELLTPYERTQTGKDKPSENSAEQSGKADQGDAGDRQEKPGKDADQDAAKDPDQKTEKDTEQKTEKETDPIPEPTEPRDFPYLYEETLCNYRSLLEDLTYDGWEPPHILLDLTAQMGTEAAVQVGYTIEDFSGDGVPELLIGAVSQDQGVLQDSLIYAIYTLDGDTPVLTLESDYRSAWYWGRDGLIFVGSGGAICSCFGGYSLTPDGKDLVCRDFWYTHEVDGDFENIGCFYNTTGEFSGAPEELLTLSLDDFDMKRTEYLSLTRTLTLLPLVEYSGVGDPSYTEFTWLEIDWAENVLDYYGEYMLVSFEEEDPYAVEVAFEGDHLQDFKILSLFMNLQEDGSYDYDVTVFYDDYTPTAYMPLVIPLTFYGDLPSWGVSYTDLDGVEHRIAIGTSGYDGSLVLTEF